jgi:hypothetical protein
MGFDALFPGQQRVAGEVEPVFGAFGEPDVEQFGQGRALRPGDECPFAQRLNETVGNHELRRGNLAGVEAEACNDCAEP